MFEDIKRNKMKSWFIILLFLAFIAVIVYYICMALDLGKTSIVIAMIFAIISTWGSYYYSDRIVLSLNKARPATKEENQKLVNILDSLVVSSGLPATPKLYIVEDSQPNAFATGRNPEHAVICVTTGLLDKLEYYELEGVIAHEMSHIKNYDILLTSVVTVMVGFLVMIADLLSRSTFWGSSKDRDDDSKVGNILMIVGFVLLIFAPILGKIMQMALSRNREYLADSTAVEITRNPDGLISALRKLDSDSNELKTANNATANLFIVSPFKAKKNGKKKAGLFDTHPSIDDRIAALQNIH